MRSVEDSARGLKLRLRMLQRFEPRRPALNKRLLDLPLLAPRASENKDNVELSEWVVGVRWLIAYPRDQAKRFGGAFANQNIVCALRDEATLVYLANEFKTGEAEI